MDFKEVYNKSKMSIEESKKKLFEDYENSSSEEISHENYYSQGMSDSAKVSRALSLLHQAIDILTE